MTTKKLSEEMCTCENCHCQPNYSYNHTGGGALYAIGIFGAAFYFFPQAAGINEFLMALVKSLGWPAVLVYQALSLLKL
jgi:hypothetical protein